MDNSIFSKIASMGNQNEDKSLLIQNVSNYGIYAKLSTDGVQDIVVNDVIDLPSWDNHVRWITNIMKDGIELEFVHNMYLNLTFDCGTTIKLSIFDYYINIVLWYLFLRVDEKITPSHIYFEEFATRGNMKAYIDDKFIDVYRDKISNTLMNTIIDDAMCKYAVIDDFSFYLCNTINIEDFIAMMEKDPEVYNLIHGDFSKIPIEDVKNAGLGYMRILAEKIKQSDEHCLRDSLGCGEAINIKQAKEVFINIGTKPDGTGGVLPYISNTSFITGGVKDIYSYYMESSGGRIAQIINKTNVGSSGHFARLLSLNNIDTRLNSDPEYDCGSRNFEVITIKDKNMLKRLGTGRTYRLNPNGVDMLLTRKDYHLIGQTIYMRSPMTCVSAARGHGICYKCYGKLANTNRDLNIGQLASELLSSKLTQKLLSAKHLFESKIKKIEWVEAFNHFFDLDCNVIRIADGFNVKNFSILIDPDAINAEDDADEFEYNEYVNVFEVRDPAGNIYPIYDSAYTNIYLTEAITNYIVKDANGEEIDGKRRIIIPMESLVGYDIFLINLENNELSDTLNKVKAIINKDSETTGYDRNTILQKFLETLDEGGLALSSVHAEILLMNQIRSTDDILLNPDWSNENEPYRLITLNKALTDNPSVTVSAEYQKLSKQFFYPLTYRKTAPSVCDLFFIKNPQELIQNSEIIGERTVKDDKDVVTPIATLMTSDED